LQYIKALSATTWEAINRILVAYAKETKIEKDQEVRIDSTVVSCISILPRIHAFCGTQFACSHDSLAKEQVQGFDIPFRDHRKRAKRRMMGVMNAKDKKTRKRHYLDLLHVTKKSLAYAERAGSFLNGYLSPDPAQILLAQRMSHALHTYSELAHRAIDQTERRVLHGESVPASEKIVSLFELHTDIIVKNHRETFYGHKLCLTGGASNLITDCLICKGNLADTALTDQMLDRQRELHARYPLKVALDCGFASKGNLTSAKSKHIK